MKLTCKGKLDVIFIQKDGRKVPLTINVTVAPRLKSNLFSFAILLKEGWNFIGTRKGNLINVTLAKPKKENIVLIE